MFCTQCGAQLREGAKFCARCGTRLADGTSPEGAPAPVPASERTAVMPMPSATVRASAPQSRRRSSSEALVAVLVGVAVLAAVAVGFVALDPLGLTRGQASQTASGASAQKPTASPEPKTEQKPMAEPKTKTETDPSTEQKAESSEYILPDSATRTYTKDELGTLSTDDLWLARNEIYARHGRGFSDQALQEHFNATSWYERRYDPQEFDAMESPLNEHEKANVEVMLQIEQERGSSRI